jgi:hypothetical protein
MQNILVQAFLNVCMLVSFVYCNDNIVIFASYHSEPIAEDYRTCVCPFIDVIAHDTFEYRAQDEGARGAFDWEFFYKRLPLLPEDLKHPTEPFK